jgi:hypothetical protein
MLQLKLVRILLGPMGAMSFVLPIAIPVKRMPDAALILLSAIMLICWAAPTGKWCRACFYGSPLPALLFISMLFFGYRGPDIVPLLFLCILMQNRGFIYNLSLKLNSENPVPGQKTT